MEDVKLEVYETEGAAMNDPYDLNEVDWDNMNPYLREVKKLYTTFVSKNHDYGNSFDQLCDEFGIEAALIRLSDKLNRLKTLHKSEALVDESMRDTLEDMANYAILTLMWMNKEKQQEDFDE